MSYRGHGQNKRPRLGNHSRPVENSRVHYANSSRSSHENVDRVRTHYNHIKERNRDDRKKSSVFGLRCFNNWVKQVLAGCLIFSSSLFHAFFTHTHRHIFAGADEDAGKRLEIPPAVARLTTRNCPESVVRPSHPRNFTANSDKT